MGITTLRTASGDHAIWSQFLDIELGPSMQMKDAVASRLLRVFAAQEPHVCGIFLGWAAHHEHEDLHQAELNGWLNLFQARFQGQIIDGPADYEKPEVRMVVRGFSMPTSIGFQLWAGYRDAVCEWAWKLFIGHALIQCPAGVFVAISGSNESQVSRAASNAGRAIYSEASGD